MKLTLPKLSFVEKLDEFDFWITPSLGEITSSSRYLEVQNLICALIEIIGTTTKEFEKIQDFSPEKIAKSIVIHIRELNFDDKIEITSALATFLFLVTGKSDNNCKCQFPLFLRDVTRIIAFPKISGPVN